MIDVVIVRSNSVMYDMRVNKIANSLSKKFSTVVLGWNREGLSKDIVSSYAVSLRLHNQRSPYGKPSLIVHYPLFWTWIFFQLIAIRPKIVHACDFDTILPCYIYKKLFRKKLVYDIFDRYALANIPRKFTILHSVVNSFEEILSRKSDKLIVVAENIIGTFRKKPENYSIIRNCPDQDNIINPTKFENSMLTLVYTGNVERVRGLERIISAINNLEGVELVFAGRIVDKEFFDQISKTPNVKYMGLLLPVKALELEGRSDVMMILYDLSIPNHKVANPNKTFEAMMFGLPVVTNLTSGLIHETNCGILVDYNNIEQIRSAIISLRDDIELRRRLGDNGRKAFEQKYSWRIMEKELYNIYEQLLKS